MHCSSAVISYWSVGMNSWALRLSIHPTTHFQWDYAYRSMTGNMTSSLLDFRLLGHKHVTHTGIQIQFSTFTSSYRSCVSYIWKKYPWHTCWDALIGEESRPPSFNHAQRITTDGLKQDPSNSVFVPVKTQGLRVQIEDDLSWTRNDWQLLDDCSLNGVC